VYHLALGVQIIKTLENHLKDDLEGVCRDYCSDESPTVQPQRLA
jgi:hypothetical protein